MKTNKRNLLIAILTTAIIFSALLFRSGNRDTKMAAEISPQRFQRDILGCFDTAIMFTAFCDNTQHFDEIYWYAEKRFSELSKLFDEKTGYNNINNIKTVNDYAGILPVTVHRNLADAVRFSIGMNKITDGNVNIADGRIISLWEGVIKDGYEPPDDSTLNQEAAYSDIGGIIVEGNSIFIKNRNTKISLQSVAKGFACEVVSNELKGMGMENFLISFDGQIIKAVGSPIDKEDWNVGIQNPTSILPLNPGDYAEPNFAVINIRDRAVGTAGDYQEYRIIDDVVYHSIISPKTKKPSHNLRSVTVICTNAADAYTLARALFCMSNNEGKKFAKSLPDTEVLWLYNDGTYDCTENMFN